MKVRVWSIQTTPQPGTSGTDRIRFENKAIKPAARVAVGCVPPLHFRELLQNVSVVWGPAPVLGQHLGEGHRLRDRPITDMVLVPVGAEYRRTEPAQTRR